MTQVNSTVCLVYRYTTAELKFLEEQLQKTIDAQRKIEAQNYTVGGYVVVPVDVHMIG